MEKDNRLNLVVSNLESLLIDKKIDEFYELLKCYLKQIDKEEFEKLITMLMKLSSLEKDETFKMVTDELRLLKGNYIFDTAIYLQDFYLYIAQNKIKQAKVCFKIISKYSGSQMIINEINNVLEREKVRLLLLNIIKQMNTTNEMINILWDVSLEQKQLIFTVFNEAKKVNKEFRNLRIWDISTEPDVLIFRIINPKLRGLKHEDIINNIFELYKLEQYQLCINMAFKLFQDPAYNLEATDDLRELFSVLAKSYFNLDKNRDSSVRKYLSLATLLNNNSLNREEKYNYIDWINQLSNAIGCTKRRKRANKKIKSH